MNSICLFRKKQWSIKQIEEIMAAGPFASLYKPAAPLRAVATFITRLFLHFTLFLLNSDAFVLSNQVLAQWLPWSEISRSTIGCLTASRHGGGAVASIVHSSARRDNAPELCNSGYTRPALSSWRRRRRPTIQSASVPYFKNSKKCTLFGFIQGKGQNAPTVTDSV